MISSVLQNFFAWSYRHAELQLIPATLLAWASAGVLIGLSPSASLVFALTCLWGFALIFVLLTLSHRFFIALALGFTAAALLASIVAVQAPARASPELREAAQLGRVELVVQITGPQRQNRVLAQAELAYPEGQTMPSRGALSALFPPGAPVLLFGDDEKNIENFSPKPGELWRVDARMRATEPGQNVSFLAFVEGQTELLAPAPPALATATFLREGLAKLSETLSGSGADLLPGLAVGDTRQVGEQLNEWMIVSSLSHLTAVSGANCSVIIAAVFALCSFTVMRRGFRVVISLAALIGFVMLVTPEPSVLRASVMAGVVLLALASGRPARGVPVLCLAVIVLLASDPWLSRSYGFALSALATAGLLLLAGPLAKVFARKLPAPLALLIAVPLSAQLACQPVLLLLAPQLPLWGVPANLLAAPAAPLATGLGLLACLALPIFPALAQVLVVLAWFPATWVAAVAEFFAELPLARMPWPGTGAALLALVFLSILLLCAILAESGSRMRRLATLVTLIGFLAYPASLGGVRLSQTLSRPTNWQYAMCDVGQGDALVIRSAGFIAVVDTGPDVKLMQKCLSDLAVTYVDLLVLTHFDLDHVGGTEAVIGQVGTTLVSFPESEKNLSLLDDLRGGGADLILANEGMRGALGDLRWQVLWPRPGAQKGNAASVTLLIEGKEGCEQCLSALLLGDLGEVEQNRILGANRIPKLDLLKVAHHGSADFSERLYLGVSARIGLIGVGVVNSYGHPSDRVLNTLSASNTGVFRTDLHGLILVAPPLSEDLPPRVWTRNIDTPA